MDELKFHELMITSIIQYGLKLLIHSRTSNGGTVDVWDCISNFIPHFTGHVIIFLLYLLCHCSWPSLCLQMSKQLPMLGNQQARFWIQYSSAKMVIDNLSLLRRHHWKCTIFQTRHHDTSSSKEQSWPTLILLTHWGREKWTPFRRRQFQVNFLEWKCLNSD